KAVIEITSEKLTHGIASVANPIPWFRVKADAFPANAKNVKIQVDNRLLAKHETRNVVATILGTKYPDSMFVFTAHYDHLGTMGRNVFFPGANDNASGVSMMLTLARYFKDHPLPYTLVFMAFSGEELGLLGSSYFADNPLIDLKAVKFLVNLDMVGNGSEGITVVNGGVFHEWYSTLVYINDAQQLLATVKKRGEACNSDHCPFYRKGVPSFFIYTMGGISAYHDLDDTPENLSFKGFEGLMLLLTEFARRID
ncbi:MAG: M28 family peptidase, partial [Bacteroidales bacterium]|nr:M28 family peptidase [Bacteroidales bacterium]